MKNLESAKVLSGYILGSLAFIACVYFAWLGPNPVLQVLLCLSGASVGWLLGIVITPLDEGEKKQFSDYAKGVSALASGFAIAKFDVLLTPLATKTENAELVLTRGLLVLVCFFVALLFTFIGRRYIHAPEEERREKRQKHLKEAQEALAKLAGLQ